MRSDAVQIHARDNVAVSLRNLDAGVTLEVAGRSIRLPGPVPAAHKLALRRIGAGEPIVKFGYPIGRAMADIACGAWVHAHNLGGAQNGSGGWTFTPAAEPLAPVADGKAFLGYRRANGEVGIRNELWILPTVGCVNEIAQTLARQLNARALPGNISGVYALPHPFGCSQLGDDHATTQRVLAALAQHPNAGGVLVIGLGCEANSMASFRKLIPDADTPRYQFVVAQEVADELAAGRRLLDSLVDYAAGFHRERIPLAELRVGLKCGGSDALSPVTANPVVGAFSDALVARGGTTVLTEVPEVLGAETLFLNRCAGQPVFEAGVALVDAFKAYLARHGRMAEDATANKDGATTTPTEKSLGCLQKGGSAPVVDVVPYGGRVQKRGLNFLGAPHNDIVAITALAAAGAHVVLFATGRGTPLGGPVPTLKIATNSELAARKANWIDFDAGQVAQGSTIAALGDALLEQVIETASGQPARNELNGFREIALFKDGVPL